jgi:hypothetical protein
VSRLDKDLVRVFRAVFTAPHEVVLWLYPFLLSIVDFGVFPLGVNANANTDAGRSSDPSVSVDFVDVLANADVILDIGELSPIIYFLVVVTCIVC